MAQEIRFPYFYLEAIEKMPAARNQASLRVLVLSKRQYMSRDLLDDRYGRFRELPLALSSIGFDVRGLCLSYRPRPELTVVDDDGQTSVTWTSRNLKGLLPFGTTSYWHAIDAIGREFRPDIVWAGSDVPHAVLGVKVARRLGARLVIDLYDNFESYPLARIPGVNRALQTAVRAADGVTCVSAPLLSLVRDQYSYQGKLEVIENAIPPGVFQPMDKAGARAALGLPAEGIFIGTAGSLSRGRGTDVLFEAFARLATERPDLHLVLAGPVDSDLEIPRHERIHYLGFLSADSVPMMLSTLDVSVICNRDTLFARYCFPQKLYESLACGIPVAVARVGAMTDLLAGYPGNLYAPDDVSSLTETLRRLCLGPVVPDLDIPTWTSLGMKLSRFLASCCDR